MHLDLQALKDPNALLPSSFVADVLARAAAVLKRYGHDPGASFTFSDFNGEQVPIVLNWNPEQPLAPGELDESRRNADAADAILLALVAQRHGWRVVRRLQRSEGADWLLRSSDTDLVGLQVRGAKTLASLDIMSTQRTVTLLSSSPFLKGRTYSGDVAFSSPLHARLRLLAHDEVEDGSATESAKGPRPRIVRLSPRVTKLLLDKDPSQLLRLSPEDLESFVAERFDRMGYAVRRTGAVNMPDGGVDIIAVKREPALGQFLLAVQVKHHHTLSRTTGRDEVDRLLAWKGTDFQLGMLVTNTRFSAHDEWLAKIDQHRNFLRLRDFEDLKRWIKDDFISGREMLEIPSEIELAPGIRVSIPML